jgi:F0F1-type ATP synthase assembly protein I
MKTKHSVYVYQIIQSIIVLVFGIIGIALYLKTDPVSLIVWLIVGYILSIVFVIECLRLNTDHPVYPIVFKEL